MKIAYFDCFAGASGNMILGSLVDAGLPVDKLAAQLRQLPVTGWQFDVQRVNKRGLAAQYLDVHVPGEDHHSGHAHNEEDHHHEGIAHRTLDDVLSILRAARFPHELERAAESIFRRLAAAEALVHGTAIEQVVFHEVGQVDAIIDVAGAVLGLHLLSIDRVYCSALPCGTGRIRSAHGESPSPSPATMELLRGCPTYFIDLDAEFVTPTGAAILSTLASFEPRPPMTVHGVGYGSGRSDFPFPNVVRVLVGEMHGGRSGSGDGDVVQLETNIDDMNPQLFEHVFERVFAAGALDVWTQAASMKKGRPGVVLSALVPSERESAVAQTILAETTTIGVRAWPVRRTILPRRGETVETSFGPVRVKVVHAPNGIRVRPEYEDCREIAERDGLALAVVMERIECEIAEHRERD